MEREEKAPLSLLMSPALREGYLAALKVFEENEYKPIQKINRFRNGNVKSIRFNGLTREIVLKLQDAIQEVMIDRDEKNLDVQGDVLRYICRIPAAGSLSNASFFSID